MMKRLFFGIEAHAPWPLHYPEGRILHEAYRHMTLAFLGNVEWENVRSILHLLPIPEFKVGIAAYFNRLLLLPSQQHPNVAAWHVDWIDPAQSLLEYQRILSDILLRQGFNLDSRSFLPHVTICRAPCSAQEWEKSFLPLPCFFSTIHLYESVGNLQYESLWSHALKPPFEEVEHTADIAFIVYADNIQNLHRHAVSALAFRYPPLLAFSHLSQNITSLNESIMALNEIICKVDGEIGCPFKAVSFHGALKESEGCLTWEMIVDV